jgi:hypothetical protein
MLSSSTTPETTTTAATKRSTSLVVEDEPEVLLFQRHANASLALMRSGLAFTTFHSLYWIWYVNEFIPMVNQAAMQELHINPAVGYGGLLLAFIANAVFIYVPRRVVSKLGYRPQSKKIIVYTHRLPAIRPNRFPSASFPIGRPNFSTTYATGGKPVQEPTYFKLSPVSASYIMELAKQKSGSGGYVELGTDFTGLLTAGPSRPYYMIQIQDPKDVPDPELLLEALQRPETLEEFLSWQTESPQHERSSFSSSSSSRGRLSARAPQKKSAPKRRRK